VARVELECARHCAEGRGRPCSFFCCRVWFSFEDGAAASSLVVSYKARNFLNMVETIVCVFYYIKGSLNLQLHGTEGVRGPL